MNPISLQKKTQTLKELAFQLGFDFCGISKAEFLEEDAKKLEAWLQRKLHGQMSYMEHWFDLRIDPRNIIPGAQSVISLMANYTPRKKISLPDGIKISRYAYGLDYHKVIRKRLKKLIQEMKKKWGEFQYRIFTDSGPVLEKAWAVKSGLGWMGKHTNIINRTAGSYFFLSEIICDVDFEPDGPIKDYCGTCRRCIDACPTEAIHQPYELDASKCISYLTIELREQIPEEFHGAWKDWIFGCDICQEVCPWNKFSSPHKEPQFEPLETIMGLNTQDWLNLTEDVFEKIALHSPLKRAGLQKIKNTIRVLKTNKTTS